MPTADEYLHTSFEHDAEFVDGRIVERSEPTWEHSCTQGFLIEKLWAVAAQEGSRAVPEQRARTRAGRFRVPDVCIARRPPESDGGIVTSPPYLCVEILSPDDTTTETFEKVREYPAFGVQWVWVIDPVTRAGQVHSSGEVKSVQNVFFTDRFEIDLAGAEV